MGNITVYEGNQPYIFISYAHANSPAVLQVLEELSERGYRIWYDSGIEVGSEWPEYIAGHLAGASLMIAFLSNAYMRSDNCRKEMHYALTKKVPVINIFLEETSMTPGMEMQIGNLFALMKYSMPEERFEEKLFTAPQLTDSLREAGSDPERERNASRRKPRKPVPVDLNVEEQRRKKKKIRRGIRFGVFSAVLIAVLVLGIVGWSTGLIHRLIKRNEQTVTLEIPSDDTEIVWTDSLLERIARSYTGIPEGPVKVSDLARITELHISGAGWAFDRETVPAVFGESETGTEPAAEVSAGETLETEASTARETEAEAPTGEASTSSEPMAELRSLSDLHYFPSLVWLYLEDQPLSDLESLAPCGIETLVLSGCELTSLRGIANLPLLRDLNVADCPLRDLSDLEYCLELRRLCLLGGNVKDLSPLKPLIRLSELELSGFGLNELGTAFGLSGLSSVSLHDCDLRGSFFYAFDSERKIVNLLLSDCKLDSTRNLEDFQGLTTLTLIRTGENLNWSALARLPVLKNVYADSMLTEMLRPILDGSGVTLSTVYEP